MVSVDSADGNVVVVNIHRHRRQAQLLRLLVAVGVLAQLVHIRPSLAACDPFDRTKQCLDPIPIDGDPVDATPPIVAVDFSKVPGTGICAAFRFSSNPNSHFAQQPANWPATDTKQAFADSVNNFLDYKTGNTVLDGKRTDQTLRTVFDLANNIDLSNETSQGDYPSTDCGNMNGCPFPGSSMAIVSDGFGTRFRGYLYVPPEWVGAIMHFGFFVDDRVAVNIFSKTKDPLNPFKKWLVLSHGLDAGSAKFRLTNQVTFPKSGLYPIEIVHAQVVTAAILEFAIYFSSGEPFQEVDEPNNTNQTKLNPRFQLSYTEPAQFYQTSWGRPAYQFTPTRPPPNNYDLDRCLQCPRENADWGQDPPPAGGMGAGCEPDHFCNEAAVCAPCLVNRHCGASCQICTKPSPVCVPDVNDPDNAQLAHCDQCNSDNDCPAGQKCTANNKCVQPPCCPSTPHSIMPDAANPNLRLCSPCAVDADCTDPNFSKCDTKNARCTDQIPINNEDGKCGVNGTDCKTVDGNRPFCLNGQVCVECRADADCPSGKYCESGSCKACTVDRHCGARCGSCGTNLVLNPDGVTVVTLPTNTPVCYSPDNTVQKAVCVRCVTNSDCGDGGQCDAATHDCVNKCDPPCAQGLRCQGGACVECFNSSQCLCGSCDTTTGSCTESCHNNMDCQGNQCCALGPDGIRKCQPGRCAGVAGGALCGCSVTPLAAAAIDNNTLDPNGGEVSRSHGALAAALSMLLCGWLFRRRAGIGIAARGAR